MAEEDIIRWIHENQRKNEASMRRITECSNRINQRIKRILDAL